MDLSTTNSYNDICNNVCDNVINSNPELIKLAAEWVNSSIDLLPLSATNTQLPEIYLPLWGALYEITPPKIGEEDGNTKGSGNGELALYWFLKSKHPSIQDNRSAGVGVADLIIKDTNMGIEVKAYPIKEKWLKIGKYGRNISEAQKMNNICIETIFGLDILLKLGDSLNHDLNTDSVKAGNISNFNYVSIKKAFNSLLRVDMLSIDPVLTQYDFFKFIESKIKQIVEYLDIAVVDDINVDRASKLANRLLYKLLMTKLEVKPGNGGFIAIVDNIGNIEWLKIDFNTISEKFKKIDNEYVKANTGELFVYKTLLR